MGGGGGLIQRSFLGHYLGFYGTGMLNDCHAVLYVGECIFRVSA